MIFLIATLLLLSLVVPVSNGQAASSRGFDASSCVKQSSNQFGVIVLENTCGNQIEVQWCVTNSNTSSMRCSSETLKRNGIGGGAATLPGSKKISGTDANAKKGESVAWVACYAPAKPRNWRGPGSTADCVQDGNPQGQPSVPGASKSGSGVVY